MAQTITGGAGADLVRDGSSAIGGSYDDLISGGGGNDTLVSQRGNDTLDGGEGRDTASFDGVWSQWMLADLAAGRITRGGITQGSETLQLRSIEDLYGSKMNDTLLGSDAGELLDGADGSDWLDGRGGDDLLRGGAGNDTLVPGAGRDTLDGGADFDLARFADVTAALELNLADGLWRLAGVPAGVLQGIEALHGGKGDDTLVGDSGANRLDGYLGNDALAGGAGDDTLIASWGNDTLDGGAGIDRADFANEDRPLAIDLAAGTGSVAELRYRLVAIEQITGGSGADQLAGSAADDHIDGGPGDDHIDARSGNDQLSGGAGADWLQGGAGDDDFLDLSDGDTLDGGPGRDALRLNKPNPNMLQTMVNLATGEFIFEGVSGRVSFSGIEAIYAGKGQSLLIGDAGDNYLAGETLVGGRGNDTLHGTVADYRGETAPIVARLGGGTGFVDVAGDHDVISKAQVLRLGSGDDTVFYRGEGDAFPSIDGGAGNDRLTGAALDGGPGDDTLEGRYVTYAGAPAAVHVSLADGRASGGYGEDLLIGVREVLGSAFADRIDGDALANTLYGGPGEDRLDGGAGNDSLFGGSPGFVDLDSRPASGDTLIGGPGNDTLVANGVSSRLEGGDGDDLLLAAGAGSLALGGAGDDRFGAAGANSTLDGGSGFDTLLLAAREGALRFDLAAGILNTSRGPIHLLGIERIAIESANDGSGGGQPMMVAHVSSGHDSADSVSFALPMDRYVLERGSDGRVQRVAAGEASSGGLDIALQGTQRLVFADRALAFGARAIEVADVAFALWGPAIAGSANLFGRGISWYDQGANRAGLVDYALGWFADMSDAALAERLAASTAGTLGVAELATQIATQGRAAAVARAADSAAIDAAVQAAGLAHDGIVCAVSFAGQALFGLGG